jgi:cytochrome c biogenesis protein CcmG, thiol:disulfide interchange protein DsbE
MPSPDASAAPTDEPTARRSPVPVAVIVLAVLLITLLAYGLLGSNSSTNLDTAVQRREMPPAPATDVLLPRLGASGTDSLAAHRGEIVVVNVWASWCPPCEDEAPILSAVHRALEKTGEGGVLGITHVDPSAKSLAKVREWGLPYPSLRDVDDKLYDAFGASAPPETYFLDREGRVVAISRGALNAKFANRALAAAGTDTQIDPTLELGSRS